MERRRILQRHVLNQYPVAFFELDEVWASDIIISVVGRPPIRPLSVNGSGTADFDIGNAVTKHEIRGAGPLPLCIRQHLQRRAAVNLQVDLALQSERTAQKCT